MRKILSAAIFFAALSQTLFGEVRLGGLITPKSVSEKIGPLGQALFVSVGSKSNRFEFFSDLSLLRKNSEEAGARHTEDALTVLAGYRHTFLIDAVNPSLTLRAGYQRQVLEDQQMIFGYPAGVRIVDEGGIAMLGVGVEYRLHKRIMLGAEASLWGMIRETRNSNWEVGIQFPVITASYSLF